MKSSTKVGFPSIAYENLFSFRSVWMGVAILWVALYHSGCNLSFLSDIKYAGYGGVDIFFFASGVGCYYSLQKQPDILSFLKKRIKRILPAYYIILLIWLLLNLYIFQVSISPLEIVGNVLCTGAFSSLENQFNWYISSVWLSYLLAPYLVSFTKRSTRLQHTILFLILVLVSVTFCLSTWNDMLTMTRLPTFYLGILFADAAQRTTHLSSSHMIIWFLLSIIGGLVFFYFKNHDPALLTTWGMFWYPFILFTPGLCILISCICQLLQRAFPWPAILLSKIGSCSFEIYLLHITIFGILTFLAESNLYQPNNTCWFLTIMLCCVLAIPFRKIVSKLVNYIL